MGRLKITVRIGRVHPELPDFVAPLPRDSEATLAFDRKSVDQASGEHDAMKRSSGMHT